MHGPLGRAGAQVGSDNGACGLHVKEVGGEGTPGRVGVKSALLALLLLLLRGRGSRLGRRYATQHGQRRLQVGERLIEAQIIGRGGQAEEQVGLAQVVIGKGPNELLDGLETAEGLEAGLACAFTLLRG